MSKASVEVENEIIASIDEGVLVFVGFDKKDNSEKIGALANKLLEYKIFNDYQNKIALSLNETNNDILLVPQVTLAVGTRKGTKPSFSEAAEPKKEISFSRILKNYYQQSINQFNQVSLVQKCQLV